MRGESFEAREDRLPGALAARLEPKLQDALDHRVRRELLRSLNRGGRSRSTAELRAELRAVRPSQLRYHLQVLRRSGVVAGDEKVKAVLRATERIDREQSEAAAAASASPLLTMFRTPRPVRTVRLRGRARTRGDQSSG